MALAPALEEAPIMAQSIPQAATSKSTTTATKAANAGVLKALPFGDKKDFENRSRGFVGNPKH